MDIFGGGDVNTDIVGGVSVIHTVWAPRPGSDFAEQQAPTLDYDIHFERSLADLRAKYGLVMMAWMPPPAGIVVCEDDDGFDSQTMKGHPWKTPPSSGSTWQSDLSNFMELRRTDRRHSGEN